MPDPKMPDPKIIVTFKDGGIDIQFEHSDKVNNRMFERMITLARRALRADRMQMVHKMRQQEAEQRKAEEEQKAEDERAETISGIKSEDMSLKQRINALGTN